MDFLELAKNRYSERFFDSRPVEQEKLDKILEAGRIVPTACNYQPQKFYLIRSKDGLEKLKTVTHFHYNVPLMILVCYDAREVWTNPGDQYYRNYNSGEQDASIAATTMMYEAEELFLVYTQQDGFARWRTTPHKYGKEGVEANKRGDMNPPQGSFFYGMYKGDLDAGVNTVNNLTGLIKSIDACEDIVNELAAPFAE